MPATPAPAPEASILVDAELRAPGVIAQMVRFDIPAPTDSLVRQGDTVLINMCLTPRPTGARACYLRRWGPHRFERLGDVFMVPPGEELQFRGDSGRQASVLCTIERDLVEEIVGQRLELDDQRLAATLDITSARVRSLLLRLGEELRHPGIAAERLAGFIGGQIAIELGRFCLEVAERPVSGGLAGWRLRLIDERLAEEGPPPSLEDLARLCGLSVRQLTRGYKASRGCPVGDHIEQRRMEAAKRLLVAGESVKAVAFALGFASPSSFTFAFRRTVGTSPSQFRQRQLHAIGVE